MKTPKTARTIFIGILLILGAVCLILSGLGVEAGIFNLSFWQIIGAIACLYWIFGTVFYSRKVTNKLQIFFPLAFLFMIFEKEIAVAVGSASENLINNWILLLAALLLSIAVGCFSHKEKHSFKIVTDGTEANQTNTFSEKQYYLDATLGKHMVKNTFGELTVHFQNADVSTLDTVELVVENAFGETNIYAPAGWAVESHITSSFGDDSSRDGAGTCGKTLRVIGKNSFGEVNIY